MNLRRKVFCTHFRSHKLNDRLLLLHQKNQDSQKNEITFIAFMLIMLSKKVDL